MDGRAGVLGLLLKVVTDEATPKFASWSGDSGKVSQSHSSASGPWEEEGAEDSRTCSCCVMPTWAKPPVYCLGSACGQRQRPCSLAWKDLPARVDKFKGILEMLRGGKSHVVGKGVLHAKATKTRHLYGHIDKMEAFVCMVGGSMARLEEQVARAEAELGAFPRAFRRLLHVISVPSLFNTPSPKRTQHSTYESPILFWTEDHFPCCRDRLLL